MHWPAQLWLAACRLATRTKELFPLHLRGWQLRGLFWLIVLLVTKKNTNKTKSSSNLKHVSADPASCCCFFHFLFVCVCVRACACVSVSLSFFLSFLFCFAFCCLFVSLDFLNPLQEIGVASQQLQEQRYPFLPVCAVFLCPTL